MERLLTVKQTADHFQVTEQTVYTWVRKGLLEAVHIGRTIRVMVEVPEADGRMSGRGQLARTLASAMQGDENPLPELDKLVAEVEDYAQNESAPAE